MSLQFKFTIFLFDMQIRKCGSTSGLAMLSLPEWAFKDHQDFSATCVRDCSQSHPLFDGQWRLKLDGSCSWSSSCNDDKVSFEH